MTLPHRLAGKISSAHQLEGATAIQIVDLVLNGLAEAIVGGDAVEIPGLGALRAETLPERRDLHPSTGAAITIPASTHVIFEPAS